MDKPPVAPACLGPLRWPLTVLIAVLSGALGGLAGLADPAVLDAQGGWLTGTVMAGLVLCVAAWTAPSRGRKSRM